MSSSVTKEKVAENSKALELKVSMATVNYGRHGNYVSTSKIRTVSVHTCFVNHGTRLL